MNQDVFSQRLKQLRQSLKMLQYAVADALCVSRSCMKHWEQGTVMPSAEAIVDIALYFNVTADYLLGLDDRSTLQVDFLSDRAVGALTNIIQVMQDEAKARIDNPPK